MKKEKVRTAKIDENTYKLLLKIKEKEGANFTFSIGKAMQMYAQEKGVK